jgi:hypothetical protein
VLVTSIVDAGGPLALNRLLFHAYNGKATPRQISPFIVRIISLEIVAVAGGMDFWLLGEKNATVSAVSRKGSADARSDKNHECSKEVHGSRTGSDK